jgi:hypothetical protein
MHVTVEQIPEVPVGNKGILVRIRDEQGRNLGKLWVGQAHVRWAKGSVHEKNAKKLSVEDFVSYLNQL